MKVSSLHKNAVPKQKVGLATAFSSHTNRHGVKLFQLQMFVKFMVELSTTARTDVRQTILQLRQTAEQFDSSVFFACTISL